MDSPGWRFMAAFGAGVVALFGAMVGAAKILDALFIERHADVAPWEPRAVSADGRTITIEYTTPQCGYDPFDRVERVETTRTVTLTVVTGYRGGGDCDDVAVYHEREVGLDDPLGRRRLLDGRTGRAPGFGTPTTVPLEVRQTVEVSNGGYPYGFESFLRVRDSVDGGRIRDIRLPDPAQPSRNAFVSTVGVRLRPGEYLLELVQRPCEWRCELLGRSTDACRAPVELRPLAPAHVEATVRPGRGCAAAIR